MIRTAIILSLLIISIQGLSQDNTLTVSGSLKNIRDKSLSITIGSDPRTLLKADENAMDCQIQEDGSFSFKVDASNPHWLTLTSENYEFIANIIVIQGGEIRISANCKNINKTIKFHGDNGDINNFYVEWQRFYNKAYRELITEETDYNQLFLKLDQIVNNFKVILLDYIEDNKLTKLETQWLSSELKYQKSHSLRSRAFGLNAEPDALDFSFFKTLDLNDEKACEVHKVYNDLVHSYILNRVNTSGIFYNSAGDNNEFYETFYQTILEELNGKVRDVVLHIFVTDLLSRNETCAAGYYARLLGDCKSKELQEMASILYFKHISLTESAYNTGVEIIETNGKSPMEVLSQFENKIVYLDFWASWCSPCLRSIPQTMKFADHYRNKDVVVIYVGNRDQRSSLENAIKKHGILGKHIILNQNETEIWRKEFEVGGIPTYILLDRNQKVIDLDAPHPENPSVFNLIDSLLIEK